MGEQVTRQTTPGRAGRQCSLVEKVAWLQARLRAGDEAIETHFAWVFLAGDRAWKLRKPVRRDPMDYSTLEARRRDSEAEVRLNRRLAPHVYLGIRPLTRTADGRFAIGGEGAVVDWLVEMRRLDRHRMLDEMLASGRATAADLDRVSELLAGYPEPLRRRMLLIHLDDEAQGRREELERHFLGVARQGQILPL